MSFSAFAMTGAVLAGGGVSEGGALLPRGVVGFVVALVAGVRTWRLKVVLADEVHIVNFFRTISIPWTGVDRFGFDGGVWVRCRDGRQIAITAFSEVQGAFPSTVRRAQHAAEQLESVRKKRSRGR